MELRNSIRLGKIVSVGNIFLIVKLSQNQMGLTLPIYYSSTSCYCFDGTQLLLFLCINLLCFYHFTRNTSVDIHIKQLGQISILFHNKKQGLFCLFVKTAQQKHKWTEVFLV